MEKNNNFLNDVSDLSVDDQIELARLLWQTEEIKAEIEEKQRRREQAKKIKKEELKIFEKQGWKKGRIMK